MRPVVCGVIPHGNTLDVDRLTGTGAAGWTIAYGRSTPVYVMLAVGGVAPKFALPLSVPFPVVYAPVADDTDHVPASVASVGLVNDSVAAPVITIVPFLPVIVRRNVTGTGDTVRGPPKVSSSVVCPLSANAPVMVKLPADVVWPVSAC